MELWKPWTRVNGFGLVPITPTNAEKVTGILELGKFSYQLQEWFNLLNPVNVWAKAVLRTSGLHLLAPMKKG